ncbi:hypothetical protein GOBAR_DD29892 [Gossypium barbadense]|nr:hypothetical protein GOBAR_DD29892 [Gossypium barbadense]
MVMTKLLLLCFLSIFCFALTSHAATYVVGDTSGWDISSDIDSWASSKTFNVGDVLLFQYSSSHSVNELHCLGGMKLKVDVDEKSSSAGAPQAQSEGAATHFDWAYQWWISISANSLHMFDCCNAT